MKKLTLILLTIVFGAHTYAQNIITINNTGKGVEPYYTTLQAGVDAATDGDILYLYPSILSYGNATMTKSLRIVGSGYKITENPSLGIETITHDVIIGNLTLNAGSDSSFVTGCRISNLNLNDSDYTEIQNNHITVKAKAVDSDSIKFLQNYFDGNNIGAYLFENDFHLTVKNGNVVEIGHNIFNRSVVNEANGASNSNYFDNLYLLNTTSSLVYNNIFLDRAQISGATIFNNIFLATWNPLDISNSSVISNIFSNNATLYQTENLINQGTSGICVGYPTQGAYSFDERYQLADGSPAEGYGLTGDDCGVFTQMNPYKLSGIPNIPLIYEFQDSTTIINDGQLQLILKASKQN